RANPRADANLVGRRIARDELVVVAPPAMPRPRASRTGEPVPVQAVAMSYLADAGPWRISERLTIVPDVRIRLSSLLMVRDAVIAGAGVALLPRSAVADAVEDGRIAVWSAVPHRASELWVLHASRRLASTKITAFVSFLVEAFRDRPLGAR